MINQIKYLIPPPKIWSWGAKKSQPRTGNKRKKEKRIKKEWEVEVEAEVNRLAGDG